MNLPDQQKILLDNLVKDLKMISGIKAIVLGGSHARGMATPSSDLDIGLYYSGTEPFQIENIRTLAHRFAVNSDPVVTGFYEWGAWVNGGAWIHTVTGKVDFLYKHIEQIRLVIDKAQNGEWENDFEQQPPYGFSSLIYLAETRYCIPLYDPEGIITDLKSRVVKYPPLLKKAVVQQSLWSAEFSTWHAVSFAAKEDLYNTMGCLTRAVKNIISALFALDEQFPMGDKRALDCLNNAALQPARLKERIQFILSAGGNLPENVSELRALLQDTARLTSGSYQPYYDLWAGTLK